MKEGWKDLGLYVIAIVLVYQIILFISKILPGGGLTSYFFFALFVISLVSIFWRYKFSLLVAGIPFILNIFRIAPNLFSAISTNYLTGIVLSSVYILASLFALGYLIVKQFKLIKGLTFEIVLSTLIIIASFGDYIVYNI